MVTVSGGDKPERIVPLRGTLKGARGREAGGPSLCVQTPPRRLSGALARVGGEERPSRADYRVSAGDPNSALPDLVVHRVTAQRL